MVSVATLVLMASLCVPVLALELILVCVSVSVKDSGMSMPQLARELFSERPLAGVSKLNILASLTVRPLSPGVDKSN